MTTRLPFRFALLCASVTFACWTPARTLSAQGTESDWPRFRGPGGLGVSDVDLPVTFSDGENLVWKRALPGGGGSSPVVLGDRIFLTCYTGYAVGGEDSGSLDALKRHVLCFDRADGTVLWDQAVPARLPEEDTIREGHGYASNTPAVDEERVVVFFGKSGVFAFDHAGKQLWQADVGDRISGWGSAASPVFHKNLVLINASVESESLVALDKASGREVWRARGVQEAWNTPLVVKTAEGGDEVIVPIIEKILAFDPNSGKQLWTCDTGISWYMAPSVVARDGVVYCIGGRSGGSLAVRTGGRGDVTATHRLWTSRKGSNVPSPVLHGEHLYWMHDSQGIAYCAEAATGKLVYEQRVNRVEGVYGSPVLAGGKLYYVTRDGRVLVLNAAPNYELLAVNDLEDRRAFNASPAIAHGRLYIRSDGTLYCFGGN